MIAALVLMALLLPDPDPEPKSAAPPKADVRGKITMVNLTAGAGRGTLGTIQVEGVKEKDTMHDKAMVRIQAATKIYKWVEGEKKAAKLEDVKVGARVQCIFIGPVAESYPVQATAKEVLILEAAKVKK